MSDFQSKIIEVKHLVTEVTDLFVEQKKVLDSMSETISKFGKGAKLPSDFLSAQKEVIANEKALIAQATKKFAIDKQAEQLKQQQLITAQKEANAKKAILALAESERKSQILTSKESEKQALANEKLSNTYSKIQIKIREMIPSYNDLKAKQELGIRLTAREEAQLTLLEKRLIKYREVLNNVNKGYGNYTLEVGNYAKGNSNLAMSISQISRELPNFGQSFQIGVLSLTNNVGALLDSIKQVKEQNNTLKAQGQATTSVFRQILSSVFSWQTALFIGIGLLSAYSKEIGEFGKEMFKGKDNVKSLAENQKLLNDTLKESSGSYAQEKVNIDVLYKSATDLNRSYKDRKRDVEQLQELYPFYFKNLSDEEIMTGKAKNQYNLLSQAIITVAKARASEEILQKRESERLVIEQEQIDLTMKKYKELANAKGTTTYVNGGGSVAGAPTSSVQETAEQQKQRLRREIQDLRNESVQQRDKWAKEDAFFIAKIAEGNVIEETLKKETKVKNKTDKDLKKSEKDRLDSIEKNAKIEYDLKISNLEKEKQIAQDKIDLASTISQNEEIKYQDTIDATMSYNKILLEIERAKYEEDIRLAKDNISEKEIAYNKWFVTVLKLSKDNAESLFKITKDFAKKDNEVAKQMLQTFEDNAKAFKDVDEKRKKDQEQSDEDSYRARIKIFNDYVGDFANKSGFGESFDLMTKINPKTGKSLFESMVGKDGKAEWEDYFMGITTIAQDAFNLISEASQQRFEREQQRLEKDKENALKFAGDNQLQKQRIEEDYDKKRQVLEQKQWKAKKKQALFNIAIDTAQAIMQIWAHSPDPTGISQGLMTAIISGLGVAQAAVVLAQKPPEFYVGTQNAPEGLAYTNERGAELHTDKKGNIKDFGDNKGAKLTMLEAGDKIYTAEQTKRILFNDELNNILTSNNIMPSSINIQSNGVSATQMDAIIGKHFSNIQTNNTMIDKNGFNSWTEKNGNKTISDNNRIQRKGLIIKG